MTAAWSVPLISLMQSGSLNETGPLFVILNNAVNREVPGNNYSDFTITEFEHIPL